MASWFRLISIRMSPLCELARWVLERQGIAYSEACHAPVLNIPFTWLAFRTVDTPVALAPDATFGYEDFLNYIDLRARGDQKLLPSDPGERRAAFDQIAKIIQNAATPARLYAYAKLLPDKKLTCRLMTSGAPLWERLLVNWFYPLEAWAMRKALGITPSSTEEARQQLITWFETLSAGLQPDQCFLNGDALTAVDLILAASTAPITLPPEYGAPFPKVGECPADMRETVSAVRATRAGQLALRIYRDHRFAQFNASATSPSAGETLKDRIARFFGRLIANPTLLRIGSRFLRMKPVLRIGNITLRSTFETVEKALSDDTRFTIAPVNAAPMNRISGPFLLGMDRGERYDRESEAIRRIVRPDDPDWIRHIVIREADSIIAAAAPSGQMDVAAWYARIVSARVVAEYFGVPGPAEHILMQWLRSLFWDVFLNSGNAGTIRRAADVSARQLRDYLADLIAQRSADGAPGDDVLSRLVRAGELDPDGIRRNITGIIVGAVETTTTAVANAMQVLLSKSDALQATRRAAESGDEALLRQCVYEAMRFNPQAPMLLRHSRADGNRLFLLAISAMFDPKAFPDPGSFRTDRPLDRYLHFGHGMHTCYGRLISGVQIPQLVGAIVRRPRLRRAPGRYRSIVYEGPFPDRLVVAFGDGE